MRRGNLKLVGTRIRHQKNGMDVLETKWVDKSPPCKQCGKEPTQQGSSRCQKCSIAHKEQKLADERLQKKIAQQKLESKKTT